jgi:hypothetical protein
LKHIEGTVQVTASIKRHWQRAFSAIAGGSTRDSSSGGKRISLSPMPIYFIEAQRCVHMGTDDNGYELAVCHQLGKAAKLRTGTRFSNDSPQFWGYLCLDFEDTHA